MHSGVKYVKTAREKPILIKLQFAQALYKLYLALKFRNKCTFPHSLHALYWNANEGMDFYRNIRHRHSFHIDEFIKSFSAF